MLCQTETVFLVTTQPKKLESENSRDRLKPPDRSIKNIEIGRDKNGEPFYAGDHHETGHREFEYGKISNLVMFSDRIVSQTVHFHLWDRILSVRTV